MSLEGTPTAANIREAFAREAQAALRYLYFARRADVEGHAGVAAYLRALAEGEAGHGFGHLEFLEADPVDVLRLQVERRPGADLRPVERIAVRSGPQSRLLARPREVLAASMVDMRLDWVESVFGVAPGR